jgi:hydrogenase maturation protease
VAARSSDVEDRTRCRTLLGGFGVPGLRDLDFGRNFVSYVEHLEWPEDVVVEDIPSSALLVLHRLQELRPDKLVIVLATPRADSPGSVRRYDLTDRPTVEVGPHAVDVLTSTVDLDHTLALARQWGALPETVIIEVEPAETTLGLGFSEEVGASLDRIVALVRDELSEDIEVDWNSPWPRPQRAGRGGGRPLPPPAARFNRLPRVEDLVLSVRSEPGDPERRLGGDWYDVFPLCDGWTGVFVGEVLGHGLDAAGATSRLRTAARAHRSLGARRPGQVLAHLDRVIHTSGIEDEVTALCLAIHGRRGEMRLANAGHCPPLMCVSDGPASLCEAGVSPPLGAISGGGRPEASVALPLDSTLLLFTSGLTGSPEQEFADRMARLGLAAGWGGQDPESLCDEVLMTAQAELPPGEGGTLLAIRRPA